MITNIYLVRHAHSKYNLDELNRPLSEEGINESKKVVDLLIDKNITKIISSPYKRARQTVEKLERHFKLNIIINDKFRERNISNGYIDDFDKVISKYWRDFNFALYGGESSNSAQSRGVGELKNLLKKYKGENIVIGTHGNIMVLIMNYYNKKYNYYF
ncbi:histidine phosphatase family protein [Clostridium sp.]|uniref:histidine phosphatase family protein n=1 Tax=Clostridium sp. TaxID=1506 RepID=UPI0025BF858E|nr:histidine phosphatase family protein [Clostridium sp.]